MKSTPTNRPALTSLYAGLGLTVVAVAAVFVDRATTNLLASHIRSGYPAYSAGRTSEAVTLWLTYLSVLGALVVALIAVVPLLIGLGSLGLEGTLEQLPGAVYDGWHGRASVGRAVARRDVNGAGLRAGIFALHVSESVLLARKGAALDLGDARVHARHPCDQERVLIGVIGEKQLGVDLSPPTDSYAAEELVFAQRALADGPRARVIADSHALDGSCREGSQAKLTLDAQLG